MEDLIVLGLMTCCVVVLCSIAMTLCSEIVEMSVIASGNVMVSRVEGAYSRLDQASLITTPFGRTQPPSSQPSFFPLSSFALLQPRNS